MLKGAKLINFPKFLGHKGTKGDLRDWHATFRKHLHACNQKTFRPKLKLFLSVVSAVVFHAQASATRGNFRQTKVHTNTFELKLATHG